MRRRDRQRLLAQHRREIAAGLAVVIAVEGAAGGIAKCAARKRKAEGARGQLALRRDRDRVTRSVVRHARELDRLVVLRAELLVLAGRGEPVIAEVARA